MTRTKAAHTLKISKSKLSVVLVVETEMQMAGIENYEFMWMDNDSIQFRVFTIDDVVRSFDAERTVKARYGIDLVISF